MLLISHILFFSSLVILMREDYLSRMVSVKYIIAFMAAAISIGLSSSVFSLWIYNTVVNLSVLFFLLLTIQVYYRLRYKQNNLFIDRLLGKADVLFFMALGFIFSPVNYLVTLSFYPFNRVREGQPTQRAERAGHNAGYPIFQQKQLQREMQRATNPWPIGPKY
jgi:hypothetical protein|tara:strand:- start:640 stop:1131 length:492 start_codon:yes stop_codon:yes gene_type:complete